LFTGVELTGFVVLDEVLLLTEDEALGKLPAADVVVVEVLGVLTIGDDEEVDEVLDDAVGVVALVPDELDEAPVDVLVGLAGTAVEVVVVEVVPLVDPTVDAAPVWEPEALAAG
jgi:hypothetical protein